MSSKVVSNKKPKQLKEQMQIQDRGFWMEHFANPRRRAWALKWFADNYRDEVEGALAGKWPDSVPTPKGQ